jgi:hypothetical protein
MDPKKIRNLEQKEQKTVDKMYKYKELYLKYKKKVPEIAAKISEERNKQEIIHT